MPVQNRELQTVGFGIRIKILFWSFLTVLVGIGGVTFFTLLMMRNSIEQINQGRIDAVLEATARMIERDNQLSLLVPKTIALAQANGMFGRRQETVEYLRAVLEANPSLTATYIGYEPNADTDDRTFLHNNLITFTKSGAPFVSAMDGTGRFLPYWHRDREMKEDIRIEPLVDMDISYYYQGSKNRFLGRGEGYGVNEDQIAANSAMWWETGRNFTVPQYGNGVDQYNGMLTEPYIYEGKFIVEQTFPIVIDGEFKGIAGVDRALRDLQEFVWNQKPFETARFYVISRRGRIVVSPRDTGVEYDPKLMTDEEFGEITEQGDAIESTDLADYLSGIYRSENNQSAVQKTIPGKPQFYFASYRLPDNLGGWTVVMMVDRDEIMAPFHQALQFSVGIAIAAIIILLLVLAWLANSIARRVKLAANVARRVAEGDLTVSVQRDSDDETGQLLGAIGEMVGDLNSLVGQVKRSSVELISTATQINAASKQQEASVNNFGSSTNEVTAAVKEISATSQELVKTMDDVTEVAADTANMADEGRSSLAVMEEAMRTLGGSTSSIAEKLSIINEKSNNIGSVITTITKVSDQTNLLSLNAAIEAEKAGEYGLGFAVVAREIRRLADQTAAATLDIEEMVQQMQSAVSTGVMEMEKFSADVVRGVEETASINTQLSSIIEQVQALTPRFETVHEGMQSQSMGAGQISEAMVALTEAAQGSTVSLKAFNQGAEKLQNAVNGLKEEVAKFKVN